MVLILHFHSTKLIDSFAGDDARLFEFIEADVCDGTCSVKSGTVATISFAYKLHEFLEILKPQLKATYLGQSSDIDVLQDNMCDTMGGCNGPFNELKTMTFKAPIDNPVFWSITPEVEFSLRDQNNNAVVCAKFEVHIYN